MTTKFAIVIDDDDRDTDGAEGYPWTATLTRHRDTADGEEVEHYGAGFGITPAEAMRMAIQEAEDNGMRWLYEADGGGDPL